MKKGQIQGIAFFIMLLVAVLIVAPIILKVAFTTLDQTATQLSNIDETNRSSDNVVFVRDKITGSFDWLIMFLILINILVLLITAFLIDVNPAFLIMYIIGAFLLVITLPYTVAVAERIYSMPEFTVGSNNVIQYIPMTEFILNNFGIVIVGVIVLSGIILYAKIKFGSRAETGGVY